MQTSSSISHNPSLHSSNNPPPKIYDVFLSFRGEDTRQNFTSHLHAAFCQKGIYTFLDDRRLERGKVISPELLKAIEDSTCSIVILSQNYASSKWCLDELVKILKCKRKLGQIVLPIFYKVNPSDVRKQTGPFQDIFERHEHAFRNKKNKVQKWRDALTDVADLAGWHLENNRNEANFIQEFVAHISRKVIVPSFSIPKDLFGIDSRLEKLNSLIGIDLGGVRIIGICGLGGIGKTTIAQLYYKWRSSQFEGSTFLSNVREMANKYGSHGITNLQKQILEDILKEDQVNIGNVSHGEDIIKARLCRKKVLIVIDDAQELDQIKNLGGQVGYVGSGSRIIITTRDESLLMRHGVNSIYKLELFDHDTALQHFSWHAFKNVEPFRPYRRLSSQFVAYSGGLPLALKVLGSHLHGKNVVQWKSALSRLKMSPKKEICDVLRISYDGLEELEKKIYLWIACFFNEEYKDVIIRVLDCFDFYPDIGVAVLVDKCLLSTVEDKKERILMHDLLKEMGRDIARKQYCTKNGRCNLLWSSEDIDYLLKNFEELEEVKAVVYTLTKESKVEEFCDAISMMKKLKLLILDFPYFTSRELKYLSNELKYLDWYNYPSSYLPSSFQPNSLVELHLPSSRIKQLWSKDFKPIHSLKVMNLCHCGSLKSIQELKVVPNLEKLYLAGCKNLVVIGRSLSVLRRLTLLDLGGCFNLRKFPNKVKGLQSLELLNLNCCTKIDKLPEDLEHLKSLKGIDVSGTSIKDLPSPSIKALLKSWKIDRPDSYLRRSKQGELYTSSEAFAPHLLQQFSDCIEMNEQYCRDNVARDVEDENVFRNDNSLMATFYPDLYKRFRISLV